MMKMWIRKRLDISLGELLYAMKCCFRRDCPVAVIKKIKCMWETGHQKVFVCFSVRTGFDLLFRVFNFERGSEVLISALTIPDMPKIVRQYGLVPVPLDITEDSLIPSPKDVEKAITNRTKAIVVAHLYGGICDLDPICAIAKKNNIVVIEDCAQAFYGCSYSGCLSADISMFSFGTIKTATALGGGILIIRNNDWLYNKMIEIYRTYPVQSRRSFFVKALKYFLIVLMMRPFVFHLIVKLSKVICFDYDAMVQNLSKSFPGEDLFPKIRKVTSLPLLQFMLFRFQTFSDRDIEKRTDIGNYALTHLPAHCRFPGRKSMKHTYWVFPIMVADPEAVIGRLREAGFDATQRQSLRIVDSPGNAEQMSSINTDRITKRLLYLPLYGEMPIDEIDKMLRVLRTERG
jgi:perosamine synthetase